MRTEQTARKSSHAILDHSSRQTKARHIVDLVEGVHGPLADKAVLDVGTGSGHIASSVSRVAGFLVSVDVVDERAEHDFAFRVVDSELLPFEAASFDVVISNHAVEHVNNQRTHLEEIRRVLRPGGVCYLATPNRWRPIEPHFGLPFLSWLPASLRDRYVRLAGKGERFDVLPLSDASLRALTSRAGLDCLDLTLPMVALSLGPRWRMPLKLLHPVWPLLKPLMPALVVMLAKRSVEDREAEERR